MLSCCTLPRFCSAWPINTLYLRAATKPRRRRASAPTKHPNRSRWSCIVGRAPTHLAPKPVLDPVERERGQTRAELLGDGAFIHWFRGSLFAAWIRPGPESLWLDTRSHPPVSSSAPWWSSCPRFPTRVVGSLVGCESPWSTLSRRATTARVSFCTGFGEVEGVQLHQLRRGDAQCARGECQKACCQVSGITVRFARGAWRRSAPRSNTQSAQTQTICEGGGDVVGVVTPLVGGVAQAFHDDRVVELRVQLGVQEVEGKDREEQVEVERERRVKEVRPWI